MLARLFSFPIDAVVTLVDLAYKLVAVEENMAAARMVLEITSATTESVRFNYNELSSLLSPELNTRTQTLFDRTSQILDMSNQVLNRKSPRRLTGQVERWDNWTECFGCCEIKTGYLTTRLCCGFSVVIYLPYTSNRKRKKHP